MKRRNLYILLIVGLLAIISLKEVNITGYTTFRTEISEEAAIAIAKQFVDDQVKFYIKEEQTGNVVGRALIKIVDTQKKEGEWIIELHVVSDLKGTIKTAGLIIAIDSETGKIKTDKLKQFRIIVLGTNLNPCMSSYISFTFPICRGL